jgi:hypothetical protein
VDTHEQRLPGLVLVPVVVMCALLGLALAVLGWSGWLLGPAVLMLGLVGRSTGSRWADWAVPIGVGLMVGTVIYLLLGASVK